jgi:hypothetical protein
MSKKHDHPQLRKHKITGKSHHFESYSHFLCEEQEMFLPFAHPLPTLSCYTKNKSLLKLPLCEIHGSQVPVILCRTRKLRERNPLSLIW